FFAISGVLPLPRALDAIRGSIRRSFGKKSESIVTSNLAAVDAALARLREVEIPPAAGSELPRRGPVPDEAPSFVQRVIGSIVAGRGDLLPVSAFPPDGTFPTGTARWEKRNIALEIPVWAESLCIQCNKCALVCPHAAVRVKAYPRSAL